MYSTCIFCHSPLGANEAVEEFPVGRRLAFDAAKGRLWAVCRACGRWNLSPLEERWEAVEACERAFRGTRVRVSTENVGLARLAEGTELVRIGRPLRPEFAAWRYGDQFGARARKAWMRGIAVGGVGAAVVGSALVALPFLLLTVPTLLAVATVRRGAPGSTVLGRASRAHRGLVGNDGAPLLHGHEEMIISARLRPEPRDGAPWWLEVKTGRWDSDRSIYVNERRTPLVATPAVQAASLFLAGANGWGGTRRQVQAAVQRIERAGDPELYFAAAELDARRMGWGYQDVWSMPQEIRFALEMASHEDAERRAMDGELAELERQWRAAEEIAAIADSLAVPAAVERRLREMGASRR
ncbi:MAG: hypothetical protein ABW277_00860 [Longimicrobiaceae bacterium]